MAFGGRDHMAFHVVEVNGLDLRSIRDTCGIIIVKERKSSKGRGKGSSAGGKGWARGWGSFSQKPEA